jgi:N-acetyl-anhydromuramyl-L-alanine amidase AmpD
VKSSQINTYMNINSTKFRLQPNQFVAEEHKKDLVVLHFTAGASASSAVGYWNSTPEKVATAFVLDLDGTVYQVFDPKYFAWHLGFKGSYAHDKRSIGIEIVNFGPLKPLGDTLMSWPSNYKQRFCLKSETDKYVKTKFRGFEYYAAYTPAQLDSIGPLVEHICKTYDIPKVTIPQEKREIFDPTFVGTWKGIASHQNFRPDKSDVGPAFPWERLN